MSRVLREESSTHIYHVVIRGVNNQPIFNESQDYEKFTVFINETKIKYKISIYGYVLMDNHVHLLIKAKMLSDTMKCLQTKYVYWFNTKYNRRGHLFQNRFMSECIEDDSKFLKTLRFIHNDPIRTKCTRSIAAYPHSSYRAYLKLDNPLVNTERAIEAAVNYSNLITYLKTVADDECMEIGIKESNSLRAITDEEGLILMKTKHNIDGPGEFQLFTRKKRDVMIRRLKKEGLSIRQLVRLSGYSKGTIERALK